ncbi:MAG: NUDIX hydrolase [Candidatus Accumulibacter sp.]|jgi:8-oxo-dGTP pyrophosphatase MutT (NUDIX family)|nr:NUDIX hydrolase [Accumulibacter sp.]
MVWKPHVTVAAVIERDGEFLLVEEKTDEGIRFNQPAGHLESGESLTEAVVREALEETAYVFVPRFLVGIHHWRHPQKEITYLRFAFGGEIAGYDASRTLDMGILGVRWLSLDDIRASADRHRSPMILRCVEDWLAGRRYPLELVTRYA